MSAPQLICLFALSLLIGKTAYGQPAEPAQPGKSAEEVQAIEQRAADWLTTCLGDWDAQTHDQERMAKYLCARIERA